MKLKVKIGKPATIKAKLKKPIKLKVRFGNVSITTPGYTPPTYEGETEVTPDKSTQTLNTDGYFVKDNITVHPIPDEYIVPEGTKEIVSNGEHNVNSFEKVDVNVPIPDGYIKPQGVKEIVSNGAHDVKQYESAEVNVPIPDGYIVPSGTKQISSNGSHDVGAYKTASVNVPIPDGYIKPSGTKSITSNGEHDVNAYQKVNVDVPNKIPEGYYNASGLNVDESKVLAGENYIDEDGYKIGEMPDNGAVNATIQGLVSGISTPQPVTIPEGYHNGQGKVSISSDVKTLHDNIAQALRQKGQVVSLNYDPKAFPTLIGNIQTSEDLDSVLTEQEELIAELQETLMGKAAGGGGTPTPTQEKTVNITTNGTHTVTPDAGYALSKVTANVSVPLPEAEYIEVTPTKDFQHITPSNGKIIGAVGVNPIPDVYIIPQGEKEITENGQYDVSSFASVNVNVAGGGGGEPDPSALYQRISFIESTTGCKIVTDIFADNTTGIELLAEYPTLADKVAMGSRLDSNATRFYAPYPLSANSFYYGFNSGVTKTTGAVANRLYRSSLNFLNNRVATVKEEDTNAVEFADMLTSTLSQHTAPIGIFGYLRNIDGDYALYSSRDMIFYGARISQGREIVREYIPCYRKSDGEIGLYEKYTHTFLNNEGSGTFTAGADIEW